MNERRNERGLADTRIMVVDDEPDTRDLVSMVLRERGAIVRCSGSGDDALSALEDVAPDLIVSDLSMPGVDGWELIRRVRARGSRIPALALSANGATEDVARALAAGFDAHLAKPIGSDDLVDAIFNLRRSRARTS